MQKIVILFSQQTSHNSKPINTIIPLPLMLASALTETVFLGDFFKFSL